jgi:hypothetical protein
LWKSFGKSTSVLFGYYNIKLRKSVLTKGKHYAKICISTWGIIFRVDILIEFGGQKWIN